MPIVIKHDEVFEVSDEGLRLIQSLPDSGDSSDRKELLELYKLEHETCSKRYNDLYNASWSQISYIALIAGGILAFAGDRFMPELSISLAAFPLLFWWLASFEPLNRYGDQVQERLVEVEHLVNELYGFENDSAEYLTSPPRGARERLKGLRHYQQFKDRPLKIKDPLKFAFVLLIWIQLLLICLQTLGLITSDWSRVIIGGAALILWVIRQSKSGKGWSHLLRVRFVVRMFAGAIIVVGACSAYRAYTRHAWFGVPYIHPVTAKAEAK